MTAPASDGSGVPVSVVVAVRDEQDSLGQLLGDLAAQTTPPAQVVVVDGGSTDSTLELARAAAVQDPRVRVVDAGPATPGRGRNVGIDAADQDWIAITDAGVRVEPTWLERLWQAHLDEPSADVVYGNFEFDVRSFFEESAAIAYGSPKRSTPAGSLRGPAVVSCLVHRRAVRRVGGFRDLRSGEDTIFVRELAEAGVTAAWAPGATVWWRLRPTVRATYERFRVYSYHNVKAGQQAHWHHRLARRYIPVAVGLALGATTSRRWYALPAAVLGARVVARVHRHAEEGRGLAWQAQPARLATVGALLLLNDAATAVGWWQAAREREGAER